VEYFIPRQRQSPILQMLQDAAVHAAAQQHQNPFAQFMGMQQPNALSVAAEASGSRKTGRTTAPGPMWKQTPGRPHETLCSAVYEAVRSSVARRLRSGARRCGPRISAGLL
jgi:hypothetical protein